MGVILNIFISKMKHLLLIVCILGFLINMVNAQTNSFPASGSAGIGTTTPMNGTNNIGLHIQSGDHSSIIVGDPVFNGHGGVVQTTDNKYRIFIGANLYDDKNSSWHSFMAGKGTAGISILADKGGWGNNITFVVSEEDDVYMPRMTIKGNGYIGINTTSPDEFLSVNGNIRSKEVKVEAANWPDYVFEDDYPLTSLSDLASYIAENNHLPNIPDKEQVEKEGVHLGEMDAKLLRKIEELTLYLLQQQEEINRLKDEVNNLKKR